MRKLIGGFFLAVLPAVALATGEVPPAPDECTQNEESCERACLNLDEGTVEAETVACYVSCEERAQACRASAQ